MSNNMNHTTISITTGTMLRAVLIILGVYVGWLLRDFILIILTSIILASFVESVVPYFKKIKINRVPAVVIFYVVFVFVLAAIFYLFAPLLITEIYNFSGFIAKYIPGVDFLDFFNNKDFASAKDVVNKLSNNFSLTSLLDISQTFVSNLSGGFINTLGAVFGGIFNFILIILISFYLSIQEKGIENFLRIVLPIQYEAYGISLWNRSRRKIALWIKGQMLLGLLVAVLVYLVLSLLGIKYALLLAIIAGVMELVPYGIIVALIPAVSFSYLSGGISSAFLVAGAYLIIHQFEVFLFSPLIIKNIVGLSPLVVILSAIIGFELGGVWGLVLAIPVAVFAMELMSDLEKRKISTKI
ncbi:MAG: AI-2E family transporter [bacterium]|nr:AI-2E family transporter [bacterium]